MNAGRKILTNYRLSDYVTRLRYIAKRWRMNDDLSTMFDAREIDEIADLLENMIQSPTQGSVNVAEEADEHAWSEGGMNDVPKRIHVRWGKFGDTRVSYMEGLFLPPDNSADYVLATPAALAASPEGQALIREAEARGMERAAARARVYASNHEQSSDGRNTLVLLAEWADAEAAALRQR